MTDARQRRPLFEIVQALLVQIADADGEINASVDTLELELQDKCEAYIAVIRQLESEAQALEELAHSYRVRSATRLKSAEGLRQRLAMGLSAAGVDRMNTPTAKAYFATSTLVELDDPERFLVECEDRFCKRQLTVNRAEVKAALEAGEQIAGASLTTRRHLRIG
jgi:hypothetical protein